MSVLAATSLLASADGLGPGAGWVFLIVFGGAALAAVVVLTGVMVLIGWLFLRRRAWRAKP